MEEMQLDRMEKKMDRILEKTEDKELSITIDGRKIRDGIESNYKPVRANRFI